MEMMHQFKKNNNNKSKTKKVIQFFLCVCVFSTVIYNYVYFLFFLLSEMFLYMHNHEDTKGYLSRFKSKFNLPSLFSTQRNKENCIRIVLPSFELEP